MGNPDVFTLTTFWDVVRMRRLRRSFGKRPKAGTVLINDTNGKDGPNKPSLLQRFP